MMLHGQSHRSMCLHMILRPMRVCRINNVLLMLLALILIMATPLTGNPNLQNPYGFGNRCQKHSDCSDISDELECTNKTGLLDTGKTYPCLTCGFTFSQKGNLEQHIRCIHTTPKQQNTIPTNSSKVKVINPCISK